MLKLSNIRIGVKLAIMSGLGIVLVLGMIGARPSGTEGAGRRQAGRGAGSRGEARSPGRRPGRQVAVRARQRAHAGPGSRAGRSSDPVAGRSAAHSPPAQQFEIDGSPGTRPGYDFFGRRALSA